MQTPVRTAIHINNQIQLLLTHSIPPQIPICRFDYSILLSVFKHLFVLSSDRIISNDEMSVKEKLSGKRYKKPDTVSRKKCPIQPLLKNSEIIEIIKRL